MMRIAIYQSEALEVSTETSPYSVQKIGHLESLVHKLGPNGLEYAVTEESTFVYSS